jgi:hypothetical protein
VRSPKVLTSIFIRPNSKRQFSTPQVQMGMAAATAQYCNCTAIGFLKGPCYCGIGHGCVTLCCRFGCLLLLWCRQSVIHAGLSSASPSTHSPHPNSAPSWLRCVHTPPPPPPLIATTGRCPHRRVAQPAPLPRSAFVAEPVHGQEQAGSARRRPRNRSRKRVSFYENRAKLITEPTT